MDAPPEDDGTVTWADLEAEAESRLRATSPSAAIDARRIVEELSGHTGAALVVARAERVTVRAVAAFDSMVMRRAAGEPLQYVLGRWGFRSLDLMVDPRALIPRPETEGLVDVALAHVDRIAGARTDTGPVVVVDLGTGTGAVALAIATERVRTEVWATDRSADALALARANLAGIGRAGARVRLADGSWFEALDPSLAGRVDVIVSNPPYVRDDDELPSEVEDWEPGAALRSGPDGLDDLRSIVAESPRWLGPGGGLVVELDPRQAATVADLMRDAGLDHVEILDDLAGRQRVVAGRRP